MLTKREVIKRFWQENPTLNKNRIPNYNGTGKMYCIDTRCAFCEFIDDLYKNGEISSHTVDTITLD